jgi:hypothetical protein
VLFHELGNFLIEVKTHLVCLALLLLSEAGLDTLEHLDLLEKRKLRSKSLVKARFLLKVLSLSFSLGQLGRMLHISKLLLQLFVLHIQVRDLSKVGF